MKHIIGILAMATAVAGEPRFAAPTTEAELPQRIGELRQQYAPYLRSLPEPLSGRQRTALPVEWRFMYEAKAAPKVEGIPLAPAWQGVEFEDAKWETTTVPEWRYQTSRDTICWYRTTFRAEPSADGKRLWLCFDGVEWEAQVYLNGELLGTHRVYYEPFRFDVTGKLKTQNTLAVRVIAGRSYGQPMTYWGVFPDIRAAKQRYVPDRAQSIIGNKPIGYHCGGGFGIFRPVYLEQTGPVRIDSIFVRNDLSDGKAHIRIECDGKPAEMRVEVLPENFEGPSYVKVSTTPMLEIPMPEARAWSPETPYLYRCRVTVPGADAKDVLFGCRSFTLVHRKGDGSGMLTYKGAASDMPKYSFAPVKARYLRISAEKYYRAWLSIWELDCSALVRNPNTVTVSKENKEYPARLVLDGKVDTRCLFVGNGAWIQFRLNDAVTFDHIRMALFEDESRIYSFDILISQDGKNWTALDYEKSEEAPKSSVLPSGDLPSGTLMLNGKPVYLRGTILSGGLNAYSYWGQTNELLHALLMMKAAHFNCVRSCQHIQMPEVREWMDRVGMMSEQDQGGGHNGSIDMGIRRGQHIHTGTVLARETYNNPGVVLLSFGNEHEFPAEPIVRAALAVDPQRIIKPISGRISHSYVPWDMPEDLRANVIDDTHPYCGWYGSVVPQTWRSLHIFSPRRLITIGEYGAEALDAYETMRDHYPPQFKPPAPDADTLWAHSQVKKQDVKQLAGLGRKATHLAEYIEASQNYQESLLADKTIGYRLSPHAVAGYFQFHFIDAIPVHWPKSIVSHDHRPKKAYYQMAQINQPVVALPQLSGQLPDAMTLWVANDLTEAFPGATVHWAVRHDGRTLLSGEQKFDVPALNAVPGQRIDLLPVTTKVQAFDMELTLTDGSGRLLSRYLRNVRIVPAELLKTKNRSVTEDPFNTLKNK